MTGSIFSICYYCFWLVVAYSVLAFGSPSDSWTYRLNIFATMMITSLVFNVGFRYGRASQSPGLTNEEKK